MVTVQPFFMFRLNNLVDMKRLWETDVVYIGILVTASLRRLAAAAAMLLLTTKW